MFFRSKRGWIGVDVGGRAIKVAQLQATAARLRITAAAVCDRSQGLDVSEKNALVGPLRAARALAERVRGPHVAATLSMGACRVESTDPDAEEPTDRCVARWTAGRSDYSLSAPSGDVESAVEGFARAGLQCEVIDGAPLALARVLPLSTGYEPGQLLGALDWGETAATFVAGLDGRAHYVRRLAGGGFETVREAVGEALGLSAGDAGRVLRGRGVGGAASSPESHLVDEAVQRTLRPIVAELTRTLDHLGSKLRRPAPQKIFVFGAGGAIDGLPQMLGDELDVATEPWRAESIEWEDNATSIPDCLMGQAIALSALAWSAEA